MSKFHVPNQYFVVSYDVTSLYTNVPVKESIQILLEKIFNDNCTRYSGFSKNEFRDLLNIAISNTYFFFNKLLYKQVDGLAMGNPAAPALANVFLCHIEEKIFSTCPKEFLPLKYARYLDDTFAVFQNEQQANNFFSFINSMQDNIQFTMEKQINNKLPFLDMLVHCNDSKISLSIFRKPTNTGLGINYFSFCPFVYKLNAIKTLVHRAYHLTSSYEFFASEVDYLKTFFMRNGFPISLFELCVKRFLDKRYISKVPVLTVPKKKLFISLPFFGLLSDELAVFLKEILPEYYPQINFNLCFKNSFTIASFFNYKDRLPADLCSNVIYEYTCGTCNSSYIGSTTKQSKIRFYQHKGISHRTSRPLSNPQHSSPRIHCEQQNHPFSIKDFSIIATSNNSSELRTLESLYIYNRKPDLNIDQSATPLFMF